MMDGIGKVFSCILAIMLVIPVMLVSFIVLVIGTGVGIYTYLDGVS